MAEHSSRTYPSYRRFPPKLGERGVRMVFEAATGRSDCHRIRPCSRLSAVSLMTSSRRYGAGFTTTIRLMSPSSVVGPSRNRDSSFLRRWRWWTSRFDRSSVVGRSGRTSRG